MSKKATRRAARQAFPKAKTSTGTKGVYGARSKSVKSSRSGGTTRPTVKPPSVRRAVISAAVMAILYFVIIQYAWKSGGTTMSNVVVAVIGFVLFVAVAYGVDYFKYRRHLNKSKHSLK